jgi:hypothetical protein
LRRLAVLIRHPASVIRHLTFAVLLFAFLIPSSEFLLLRFPKSFQRSHQLSVPGGLVAAVPLERRTAIERRAVGPIGVLGPFVGFVPGQQFLEPADVLLDDRVEHRPRLGRVAGSGSDLTPGQQVVRSGMGHRPIFTEEIPALLGKFLDQHVPGKEDGIERRVADRLDNILTLEPDEPAGGCALPVAWDLPGAGRT